MKKVIMFLLAMLIIQITYSATPTYVKAADRAEYIKYTAYCADSIYVDIIQHGKLVLTYLNVPGMDFEMYKIINGNFTDKQVKDTIWYAPWKAGTKVAVITIQSNEIHITRVVKAKVPKRVKSVRDFYENWMTGKIVR